MLPLIALCLGLLSAQLAFAQTQSLELFDYNTSVADWGRGGVHTFDPDLGSSFMSNPAILGYVKGMRWSVLDLQGGANGYSTYTQIQASPPSSSNLTPYFGKNIWIGLDGYSALAFPNVGFALYGNSYLDFLLTNPAYPVFNVETLTDYGLMVGTGMSIGKYFAIGANLKRITRLGGVTSLGPSFISSISTTTLQGSVANTGNGYGADLGVMFRSEGGVNPTLSVDWKDAGYTTFIASTSASAPTPIVQNLVFAGTMGQEWGGIGWLTGFEYRHAINFDMDITKRIGFGGELNLALFDVRAGIYQGYGTLGTSLDLWLFTLDAAMYSIERGYYGSQLQDQRIQVGLRFETGLNPDFTATDLGGKRRRLKQRR